MGSVGLDTEQHWQPSHPLTIEYLTVTSTLCPGFWDSVSEYCWLPVTTVLWKQLWAAASQSDGEQKHKCTWLPRCSCSWALRGQEQVGGCVWDKAAEHPKLPGRGGELSASYFVSEVLRNLELPAGQGRSALHQRLLIWLVSLRQN